MADPITNNISLTLPTIGGDVGTWGTPLNSDITTIDALFGANFSTVITNADVTLTTTQFQNGVFIVTGTLTGNRNLIVPLSTNLTPVACGGKFVVVNNGAGAFNLSVKTATTGSSVIVPQGFAANLYSDGANVKFASDNQPGYAVASNGNPNGQVAGTQGSVNTNASLAYDYTNKALYVCTTTGNAAGAVWTGVIAYSALVANFSAPNVQVFTSGSAATYTTPTFASTLPLYLRVRMAAGGGGGGGTSTSGASGNNTSFASWTAVGGAGGVGGTAGAGGAGGSAGTNGTGTLITRLAGGSGGGGFNPSASGVGVSGAPGGANPFGGAGAGQPAATGGSGVTNSGAGGASVGSAGASAGGGGAGEFVEFIITSPAASYTYTVGGGGGAGSTGGGSGAAGRIEVIAYWQ